MSATDKFRYSKEILLNIGIISSAEKGTAIVPNDALDLSIITKGIWVGTGGDLAVVLLEDSVSVILKSVASGSLLPIRAKRVLATGTTAQNLVGLE